MTNSAINKYRLLNQQISSQNFSRAEELIKWMGGIQAQDYSSAKYALGLRLPGYTDDKIEEAIAGKALVRCWPMRGTLHFVSASDIHWMLDLLTPGILKSIKTRLQQLELDDGLLRKCNKIIIKALKGGNQLSRKEIDSALFDSGIKTAPQQLYYIIFNAALRKFICFGIKRGTQFTFTLLNDWIPETKKLHEDEALAQLALRYFPSRGPALLKDFMWWSGLNKTMAVRAIDLAGSSLISEKKNGNDYWLSDKSSEPRSSGKTYLLPAFDEYLISYADRSPSLDPLYKDRTIFMNGMFNPIIVNNGIVIGTWKRVIKDKIITVQLRPFSNLSPTQINSVKKELKKLNEFYGKPVSTYQ
jgi:hypothetical protein